MILGDDHVACAKQAQAFAEGKMHVERNRRARRIRGRVVAARDRRGRNRLARRARSDSSCSAARADCISPETSSEISKRSRFSCRWRLESLMAGLLARPFRANSRRSTGAAWPASTKARAFSTGVCGRIPWPRFKMWPEAAGSFDRVASRLARRLLPGRAAHRDRRCPAARCAGPKISRTARQIHAPIHAQNVRAGFGAASSKCAGRFGEENHRRFARAKFFDHQLRGGQLEFAVLLEREFADPGIEQLHGCGSRGDLRSQITGRGARDPFEQVAEQFRVGVQHGFRGGKAVLAVAFDHVARQRPRRCREAEDRHVGAQLAYQPADRVPQESGFGSGSNERKLPDCAAVRSGIRSPGLCPSIRTAVPWPRRGSRYPRKR